MSRLNVPQFSRELRTARPSAVPGRDLTIPPFAKNAKVGHPSIGGVGWNPRRNNGLSWGFAHRFRPTYAGANVGHPYGVVGPATGLRGRPAVSHISRKTSEMWGTRLWGGDRAKLDRPTTTLCVEMCELTQSSRRACMGSIEAALRAGTRAAINPIVERATATDT